MQNKSYKLAFITVNYNGISDTIELIESISKAQLTLDYAIVVVDNGSKDDEWLVLKSKFPNILGRRSDANLGFAGGNNLGLDEVKADYYYFINNDTLLPIDADRQLTNMIDFLETDPAIGGLSPKIMYVDEPGMIQFAGCTPLTAITLRNRQIGYKELDSGQYQNIIPISYLHGAAMLIKDSVIQEIGRLPELYFLYYEELDWCYQISKKFKLFYYPNAYIQHKESASTGLDSPFKTYYLCRNRLIFASRNRVGLTRLKALLYLIAVNCMHIFLFLMKGRQDNSKATWRGLLDGVKWIINNGKR